LNAKSNILHYRKSRFYDRLFYLFYYNVSDKSYGRPTFSKPHIVIIQLLCIYLPFCFFLPIWAASHRFASSNFFKKLWCIKIIQVKVTSDVVLCLRYRFVMRLLLVTPT